MRWSGFVRWISIRCGGFAVAISSGRIAVALPQRGFVISLGWEPQEPRHLDSFAPEG